MKTDLHMHTTFSDGVFTPREIIDFAIKGSLDVIAITDHDSVGGLEEAKEYLQTLNISLRLINGIELGTQVGDKPVHILGYHFNATSKKLLDKISSLREAREKRLMEIVDKVKNLGYNIEVTLSDSEKRAFGRPHIAKLLIDAGYFKNVQEAFDVLLAQGKPCYVPQPKLSPEEAVELIHEAGGIAVLAHPSEINDFHFVETLLKTIKFDGIEVWHPSATKEDQAQWLLLANQYKLLTSGGSDFHGHSGRFPEKLGEYTVAYNKVKNMIEYK